MIALRQTTAAEVDYADLVSRSSISSALGAEKSLRLVASQSSHVYIGSCDGKTGCIWGLISPSLMSDRAYLWLLTTDLVDENRFLFIRHSQRVIEECLELYDLIVGDVAIVDKRAQKWLTWLGAEFSYPNERHIPFKITRESFGRR